jgi:hypothetical protein
VKVVLFTVQSALPLFKAGGSIILTARVIEVRPEISCLDQLSLELLGELMIKEIVVIIRTHFGKYTASEIFKAAITYVCGLHNSPMLSLWRGLEPPSSSSRTYAVQTGSGGCSD